MEKWVFHAFLSMIFAGFTSVIAKVGLAGISGELGLTVRAMFVTGFVLVFAIATVPLEQWGTLTAHNYVWLALSALSTTFTWVFYYKALKVGDVATVSLIDKGSVVVAMVLAAVLLKEHITLRMIAGAALIVAGLIVIARK